VRHVRCARSRIIDQWRATTRLHLMVILLVVDFAQSPLLTQAESTTRHQQSTTRKASTSGLLAMRLVDCWPLKYCVDQISFIKKRSTGANVPRVVKEFTTALDRLSDVISQVWKDNIFCDHRDGYTNH